jgi:hypothetical protein
MQSRVVACQNWNRAGSELLQGSPGAGYESPEQAAETSYGSIYTDEAAKLCASLCLCASHRCLSPDPVTEPAALVVQGAADGRQTIPNYGQRN